MLELIQKKVFNVPFLNGMIGLLTAVRLMDQSVDEALAVLEGLAGRSDGAKAIGFIEASNRLGTQNRGSGTRSARPGPA